MLYRRISPFYQDIERVENMEKTIVALSTPSAHSAIAVVRLSGKESVSIADKIFRPKYINSIKELGGYHAAYGTVFSDNGPIDDAVALVFHEPKSYTGENMVEISCHGNPKIASAIVAACIGAGASAAGAGEFTKRAFINGKLDLSQAEAVAELIGSESELAAAAAHRRIDGGLSREIGEITDFLSFIGAQLAVWSDYPEEEDAPAITREQLISDFENNRARLKKLISGYNTGRLIQNGIQIAIAGSPNVGKSTLMNLLCGTDRSIVTDIAGTTRDIVEAQAMLDGIALRLLDTAGIRETGDVIEQIGVERAKQAVETSDLVLLVIDSSRMIEKTDVEIFQQVKKRPHLVVYNKNDLPRESFQHDIKPDVEISAADGSGLEALCEKIKITLGINLTQDSCLIASQRQLDCVLRAEKALSEAIFQLKSGVTLDVASILLEEAVSPLAELLGKSASQAVIEQVFSKFCVGK